MSGPASGEGRRRETDTRGEASGVLCALCALPAWRLAALLLMLRRAELWLCCLAGLPAPGSPALPCSKAPAGRAPTQGRHLLHCPA